MPSCRYSGPKEPEKTRFTRWWEKYSLFITKRKNALIAVVITVLCFAPIICCTALIKISLNDILVLPRNSPAVEALNDMEGSFPGGLVEPYNVLVVLPEGNTVYTSEVFDVLHSFVDDISTNIGGVTQEGIFSITNILGRSIPWRAAKNWLNTSSEMGIAYQAVCGEVSFLLFSLSLHPQLVNNATDATLVTVITTFDPSVSNIVTFNIHLAGKCQWIY